MATKMNNVEVYKSMTDFFRSLNFLKSALDKKGEDGKAQVHMNTIYAKEPSFRKAIQKVNSQNIHRAAGDLINENFHAFEIAVKEIGNNVDNNDTKVNTAFNTLDDSLKGMKKSFNELKGNA